MAMLAFGGIAIAGGGGKKESKAKFDGSITLNYNQGPYEPYDPYYAEAVFSGDVDATPTNRRARKLGNSKCEKKRTVVIRNTSDPSGSAYAVVRTDNDGNYSADATDAIDDPGTYKARVFKKVKVAQNIKCQGAQSGTVTVPSP